ncbi:M1 family peptidase [Segetibacter sp. 3557_3]|uniref:M1 family metallopeptidase n=1 Tax=Segetibacter sp. 3557_3 TaxID=2547429 RepID=UPI0010587668|nr:M1 family metallopeptidase [Segetibacter sp. 3557_3]TDH29035.1 M1 family peptidase [Segetibacter sp. 3557_3]
MRKQTLLFAALVAGIFCGHAQNQSNPGADHGNKFEELNYLLSAPNGYRTASGAPGPQYWQQQADYDIAVELDEPNNILTGTETITYFNNSPNPLRYVWLQLDENFHNPKSANNQANTSRMQNSMTDQQLTNLEPWRKLEGYGMNLTRVTDAAGKPLKYTINQTMMRLDLPATLKPGERIAFKIDWNYKIPDKLTRYGRGGYEYFPEDGNNLYSIAQFYPRMAVYSDFQGWQLLQFTSGAEFALTFGNFKVKITVPADHIVAATGECQNLRSVLTGAQYQRWQQSQVAKEPLEIVTLNEALEASRQKSTAKETWVFNAQNVRDFAFNASRRLVWDAMPQMIEGRKVMCMSFYGKEAYPLYRKYSTKAVAQTLKTYSNFTIPYPYPVAQSVEAAIGMEYPMLAMNYGRAEKDGTYTEAVKYGAIGVIIHEVGHNFFPMIVNSDERQYWWMDEGLNTFCQFLTEQEFDNNYPSRRGPAHLITDYMKLPKEMLEPIMTKGDAVANVGSNAYAKAATGLNILRETIMGRELFDFAFKEYARRWAFKHPTPSDFFRTMEDASGIDLDWYWRGWFFGTDPVDISLDSLKWYRMDGAPAVGGKQPEFESISKMRNRAGGQIKFGVDTDTTLRDFYYYNPGADAAYNAQKTYRDSAVRRDSANASRWINKNFYELTFSNRGGMLMPIVLEWTFEDGTKEVQYVPVSIWMLNERKVTKVFIKDKQVTAVRLDPYKETADINEANGMWPVQQLPSRFQLFKQAQESGRGQSTGNNSMQRALQQQQGQQRKPE